MSSTTDLTDILSRNNTKANTEPVNKLKHINNEEWIDKKEWEPRPPSPWGDRETIYLPSIGYLPSINIKDCISTLYPEMPKEQYMGSGKNQSPFNSTIQHNDGRNFQDCYKYFSSSGMLTAINTWFLGKDTSSVFKDNLEEQLVALLSISFWMDGVSPSDNYPIHVIRKATTNGVEITKFNAEKELQEVLINYFETEVNANMSNGRVELGINYDTSKYYTTDLTLGGTPILKWDSETLNKLFNPPSNPNDPMAPPGMGLSPSIYVRCGLAIYTEKGDLYNAVMLPMYFQYPETGSAEIAPPIDGDWINNPYPTEWKYTNGNPSGYGYVLTNNLNESMFRLAIKHRKLLLDKGYNKSIHNPTAMMIYNPPFTIGGDVYLYSMFQFFKKPHENLYILPFNISYTPKKFKVRVYISVVDGMNNPLYVPNP